MHARTSVVLFAAACGSSAPGESSAGRSTSTADDCADRSLDAKLEIQAEALQRYSEHLDHASAGWSDCELARIGFLALEDEARATIAVMEAHAVWVRSHGDRCAERSFARAQTHPRAAKQETLATALGEHLYPLIRRCTQHPGFEDAWHRGLAFMPP